MTITTLRFIGFKWLLNLLCFVEKSKCFFQSLVCFNSNFWVFIMFKCILYRFSVCRGGSGTRELPAYVLSVFCTRFVRVVASSTTPQKELDSPSKGPITGHSLRCPTAQQPLQCPATRMPPKTVPNVVHSLELFAGSVPCRCLFLSSSPLLLCCFFLSLVPEVPQKNFIIEVPVVGGESLEKGCFGFLFQSALTDLHLPAFSGVEDVLS